MPLRKDPIPNQDKKTLDLEKYQSLPPHVPPFPPVFKSLRDEENDDNPGYTYSSRTDKYYMSRTDRDDSIENVKSVKNTYDDDKYKEENSQHQHGNGNFINKTKEEEALIKCLMSMNFKQNAIQHVLGIVTSCGG